MAYWLGIDIGTTYSGAAVAFDSRVEIFSLGIDRAAVPTIVLLRADGEVLVGDAAERRALSEPTRVAREFKRRMGDPTPFIVGGTPYGVEALTAHVLKWILAQVDEQRGGPPEGVVLTHPASWGTFKLDLLGQAARLAGIPEAEMLSEPQAAALRYAREGRVEVGDVVAVYDFGGGTLDVALVRCIDVNRFDLVGDPEGMERLGGVDFDQAVYAHVNAAVDGMLDEIDISDATTRSALARLRIDCRMAKEALSNDTDAVIPVLLPGLQTDVRLTRFEFEEMIRPRIGETIETLERCVHSAGLATTDLSAVLLVGGTSRIPLIREMVHSSTGVPVTLDSHPKFTIALGAALHGASPAAPVVDEPTDEVADEPPPMEEAPEPASTMPAPQQATAMPAAQPTMTADTRSTFEKLRIPVAVAAAVIVLVLIGVLAFGGGDGTAAPDTASPPTSAMTPAPTEPVPPTTALPEPDTTAPAPAPTTLPPTTVPATALPPETPGFARITDDSGTLTVEVPEDWVEHDGTELYLFADPSPQISASPSLLGYLDTWVTPGLTIAAVDLADAGSADQLIDAVVSSLGYAAACFDGGAEPYALGPLFGQMQILFDCDASGNIIAIIAVGATGDEHLYLAIVQAATEADLIAAEHALSTVAYSPSG